jgi:hypothetical protein
MAKYRKTVGAGITERRVTVVDGVDMAPAFGEFALNWNAARAEGGGDFGAEVLYVEQSCRRVQDGAGPGPIERDSPEDYAERILFTIRQTKAFINRDEAERAARSALDLGKLITEANLKGRWEKPALFGATNLSALKTGGAAENLEKKRKAQRQHAKWQAEADQILAKNPHFSKSRVAKILADRHGENFDTIRRKIHRKQFCCHRRLAVTRQPCFPPRGTSQPRKESGSWLNILLAPKPPSISKHAG